MFVLLKELLHIICHSLAVRIPAQPAPLQAQIADLKIPWIRAYRCGFELASLSFFPEVLYIILHVRVRLTSREGILKSEDGYMYDIFIW